MVSDSHDTGNSNQDLSGMHDFLFRKNSGTDGMFPRYFAGCA